MVDCETCRGLTIGVCVIAAVEDAVQRLLRPRTRHAVGAGTLGLRQLEVLACHRFALRGTVQGLALCEGGHWQMLTVERRLASTADLAELQDQPELAHTVGLLVVCLHLAVTRSSCDW